MEAKESNPDLSYRSAQSSEKSLRVNVKELSSSARRERQGNNDIAQSNRLPYQFKSQLQNRSEEFEMPFNRLSSSISPVHSNGKSGSFVIKK